MVSSTPQPHFTPGKDPVPILQGARWAPGPVWTGGKSRPHRDSIPDCPCRSKSLYRLNYPAHNSNVNTTPKLCEFKPRCHRNRSLLLLTNRVKSQIALPASHIVTVICKCYSMTQFFRMYKINRHFLQR